MEAKRKHNFNFLHSEIYQKTLFSLSVDIYYFYRNQKKVCRSRNQGNLGCILRSFYFLFIINFRYIYIRRLGYYNFHYCSQLTVRIILQSLECRWVLIIRKSSSLKIKWDYLVFKQCIFNSTFLLLCIYVQNEPNQLSISTNFLL